MTNFLKLEMTGSRKSPKKISFGDPIKKVMILTREYKAFYYLETYYWIIHDLYWSLPRKYKYIRKVFPNFILYILYLYFVIIPHIYLINYIYDRVRGFLGLAKKNKNLKKKNTK